MSPSLYRKPGTHIRAPRYGGIYSHHGITAGDDEVIDFGGGGVFSKGRTQVRRISREEFLKGSPLIEVQHPIKWFGITYPDALPNEESIDRALWLLANQPPPYRAGYRNCESIALWCAAGYFESFQAKRFMWWHAVSTGLVLLPLLRRRPSTWRTLGLISAAVALFTAVPYQHSYALKRYVDR